MYLNLKMEMARQSITLEEISKALSLHRNTVSKKINGGSFTIEEAELIRNGFFPYADFQYLFKKIKAEPTKPGRKVR